jgi:hypothetical protein
LQVRSAGQPPAQFVPLTEGSGHQSPTQQFALRMIEP